MDLYYAMTNYQLLECIIHKTILNKSSKAVLFLSSFLVDNNPSIIENVKNVGFFDDVIVFEEVIFSHSKQVNIEKEIRLIRNKIEKKYGSYIRGCNNIYVGQDVDSLGVYLVSSQLKYYFFEDASGSYSNQALLMEIIKDENINRYKIVKKLNLGGGSEYVLGIYCDYDSQRVGFDKTNCVDFSVKKNLRKLSQKDIDKILQIYHCKRYDLGRNKKDILLTWHYNNMGFMTLDEQRKFFMFLVDYFRDESEALFIKPHPSDKQPDYQEWFSDAVVIERRMPSELLPYLVNGKFEKGITNWSTSVYGLQGIINEIINFDKGIDTAYRDINKIFAIAKYLDSIKNKELVQKIKLVGVDYSLFCQIMKYYVKDYEKYYQVVEKGEDFCIVKKYCDDYCGKKCIALEKGESYAFSGFLKVMFGSERQDVYLYRMSCGNVHLKKRLNYSNEYLYIDSYDLADYISLLETNSLKKKEIERKLKEKREENIKLSGIINDYRSQNVALRKEIDGMLGSCSWKMTAVLREINHKRKKYGFRKNKKNS